MPQPDNVKRTRRPFRYDAVANEGYMAQLDTRIEQALRAAHDKLLGSGDLLPQERLVEIYTIFNERFGPDKLKSLGGKDLLETMHSHGNTDSLVYWLEFKNDEEFPGPLFGGIGGGSAFKFRLFRRKASGRWVSGSPQRERILSDDEAVTIAVSHRDQLIAGSELIRKVTLGAGDQDYARLQDDLAAAAPELHSAGWVHKYFSLLHPNKLDEYHNESFQRRNLIKLLQTPPQKEGLYVCAGRYVELSEHLGWPINHLNNVLYAYGGRRPSRYWRIGTNVGEERESIWPAMRDSNYVAIGWPTLGDLTETAAKNDAREIIRLLLAQRYPADANVTSRKAGEIQNFLTVIAEGDVVLAAEGETILGIGRVTGSYRYENTPPTAAPHRRQAEWLSTEPWQLPITEGLRTTVYPLNRSEENQLEIERRLLDGARVSIAKPAALHAAAHKRRLDGVAGRVQTILDRKGQAILYGPPGTGKTYWARIAARDLASLAAFGRPFEALTAPEAAEVSSRDSSGGLVRFCTFHPGYGYEDFIEGYRPVPSASGQLVFEKRAGIFKQICEDAKRSDRDFFLIIDEINRGDIPRIFGELLTLLELDKRGLEVNLPISGPGFSVPRNVRVIGTMNTADRSIALLDTALRRRFGFVELMPDISLLVNSFVDGRIPLGAWLAALNDRLTAHVGQNGRNLQIGHAYLLDRGKPVTEFSRFTDILIHDIIPLLEEYCYEDYAALRQILGNGLVDEKRRRIREELFAPMEREQLIQALLEPAPDIVTSTDADSLVEDPAADPTQIESREA
jgi:5-methylcytosine-specific restriction enzyme B